MRTIKQPTDRAQLEILGCRHFVSQNTCAPSSETELPKAVSTESTDTSKALAWYFQLSFRFGVPSTVGPINAHDLTSAK